MYIIYNNRGQSYMVCGYEFFSYYFIKSIFFNYIIYTMHNNVTDITFVLDVKQLFMEKYKIKQIMAT